MLSFVFITFDLLYILFNIFVNTIENIITNGITINANKLNFALKYTIIAIIATIKIISLKNVVITSLNNVETSSTSFVILTNSFPAEVRSWNEILAYCVYLNTLFLKVYNISSPIMFVVVLAIKSNIFPIITIPI